MVSTCDKIIEDKKEGIIGLWPSQYKVLNILNNASGPLSERVIRERYHRKSSLYSELKVLVNLGLLTREKRENIYFYSIKKGGMD